jgi:DNA-directed RNA polymerase specialized sigma24 family protein
MTVRIPIHLPSVSPTELLSHAQMIGPDARAAQERVVDVFGDKLTRLTASTCRRYFLKDQEREDVLAETYQQLFNPAIIRFAEGRGKPEHYFKGRVQNAARKIMVQRGTRRRKAVLAKRVGMEGRKDDRAISKIGSAGKRYLTPSAPPSPVDEAERHDMVEFIMGQASPRVRKALQLCYWDEWSLLAIAAHLQVNRFTLAREIRTFFKRIISQLGK